MNTTTKEKERIKLANEISVLTNKKVVKEHRRKDQVFSQEAISNLSLQDQRLFEQFGNGPVAATPYMAIHHAFEAQVAAIPDAIAAEHLGYTITYRELNRQANKLALLLEIYGISRGDSVGLFLQRSIPMLAGIMATLKVGASYVPQHVGVAPESQLKYIIESADIRVIFTLSSLKHLVPVPEGVVCIAIDELMKESADAYDEFTPGEEIERDDRCFILFTSGTTGTPNGVQVTHRNVCNILLNEPGNMGIRPGMKVSQILSIAFDMAAWEILGCLGHGGTLIIRGKDITEAASQADVIIATPSVLTNIDADRCHNAKAVAVAGEPCPIPLANKWAAFCNFYNSCGPTETTIVNTMQLCKPDADSLTIGKPTPNNTVYVLDENRKPCAIGEVGQMWGGGHCVSMGYLANDELNKKRYARDPFLNDGSMMFATGDLGRWTADGELEHYGRVDDQVKVRGFRVELDSVSGAMEKAPGCKQAVTLKLDNRNLVGFVSPASVDTDVAREKVAEALPYYCTPAFVMSMDAFPMTSRGKIDKRALIEMAKNRQEEGTDKKPEEPSIPNLDEVKLPKQLSYFKRIWKRQSLMHYHRLFVLVALVNLIVLLSGITGGWWQSTGIALDKLANVVVINFTMAILIRQQYIVNILFRIATSAPVSWPLSIRRHLGKVYHFGGIHSGGTVSGTVWFAIFIGSLTYHHVNELPGVSVNLMAVTYTLLGFLVLMIIMALPQIRSRFHNQFEKAHRFGGWTALLLFWTQMMMFIDIQRGAASMSEALLQAPGFWMLVAITISIILPWLRLKKVPVEIVRPSSHVALVRFSHTTPFAGSSTTLSRSPLMEWHSFANVPEPGRNGFRLTISRAGDWTGALIDDMPSHLWVKGITTAGVGNVDKLFKRVVWVATGSGIGPCLPHLLSGETPSQLVWATRNPRKTYGDGLVEEILEVQPDAIIWDTDAHGKPDMVKLAYMAYKDFDAEAVICISNKKLTWKVVTGMESRNIPAYGAIWDS